MSEQTKAGMVERVVQGPKPWSWVNPKSGCRETAREGDVILVSARAARRFPNRLVDAGVAKARAAAAKAEADAAAAATAAEVEAREGKREATRQQQLHEEAEKRKAAAAAEATGGQKAPDA